MSPHVPPKVAESRPHVHGFSRDMGACDNLDWGQFWLAGPCFDALLPCKMSWQFEFYAMTNDNFSS